MPRWSKYVRDLSDTLLRHVIPLFAKHRGVPILAGSGTLVSVGDKCFLITAAHVVDPIRAGGELFFYVAKGWTQTLSGNGVLTSMPSSGNRNDDLLDIAVFELSGPKLPPYPELDKHPISAAAFRPHALPRDDKEYLLVGVPSSQAIAHPIDKVLRLQTYSYRNGSLPESRYPELGLDCRTHIALGFHERKVLTDDGRFTNAPSPTGLSGSPLWFLYSESEMLDPLTPQIVGIVTEHKKLKRFILATDIAYAIEAMRNVA
jgi:hypothetical protein